MAAAHVVPFVSVEEYLHTAYSPDVDYVDGQIEERNLGELDHSELQRILTIIFGNNAKRWGVKALPGLRTQTGATRYRVPDLLIVEATRGRSEQIVRTPPLLCIEILSPEDRWPRMELKLRITSQWVFRRSGFSIRKTDPS